MGSPNPAHGESVNWKQWLAPAFAAFIGSIAGVLVQQLFVPRQARIQELAELRRSVVEEQYEQLEQARMLAQTGLEESRVVVGMVQILQDQNGDVIERDTTYQNAPAVLIRDTALQRRWDQLAAELEEAEEELHPAVRLTFNQLRKLREQTTWATDSPSSTRSPIGEVSISRWWNLNVRLWRQADSLLALR